MSSYGVDIECGERSCTWHCCGVAMQYITCLGHTRSPTSALTCRCLALIDSRGMEKGFPPKSKSSHIRALFWCWALHLIAHSPPSDYNFGSHCSIIHPSLHTAAAPITKTENSFNTVRYTMEEPRLLGARATEKIRDMLVKQAPLAAIRQLQERNGLNHSNPNNTLFVSCFIFFPLSPMLSMQQRIFVSTL